MNVTIPVNRRAIAAAALALVTGLSLGACNDTNDSQKRGQHTTETYQSKFEQAEPYPQAAMKDSLERKNLIEKLKRYNDPNKVSYIYLLSDTGEVITTYVIKGKVTSNQSQLTTDQLVRDCGSACAVPVNAPGDDGSYGPNEDGIFFFTTEGTLVTWNGKYLLADRPLKVTTPVKLIANAK